LSPTISRHPPPKIADLHKAHWEIELFFKWIKQNLKLQRLLGSSKNAITLQVIAALIAYLLVRLAQLRAKTALSMQAGSLSADRHRAQRRSVDACCIHQLRQSIKSHTNNSLCH
jgi:IS4 transposase